ncbi:hypothetical protein [Parasporobacterium paucivorans]|uniref:Uncharacterized protein n=1 Tax=Parasporobacterium paucivorans DSM 15970 TaxID=1122934 RepID=A0A1M6IPE7_9FIRM|nr:hypothetical protein [Parasporobacterium paucivorans]SHJ36316.1 hypothetical protein SAMN02745691_01815 [Parasporobacterium paucivorans DSM 15970]
MKGLKDTIVGGAFLTSGSIGVAVDGLEETIFGLYNTGIYEHKDIYYVFMLFVILGATHICLGFFEVS